MPGSFDAIASMGDDLRDWIGQHTQARQASVGEVLIQEGTTAPTLWLIEGGEAWVTTSGSDGRPMRLAALHAGSLVGEMTLLEGRPAVASVIAGEGCRVLPLDLQALAEAMKRSASLSCDVYSLFARKLALQLDSQNQDLYRWRQAEVEPLRKGLALFAHLDESDVEWLARIGQCRRFPSGAVLIRQHERVPELLLVLEGTASVQVEAPEGAIKVGAAHPGELLGEMSLVGRDDRATATVTAQDPVDVLALPKDPLRQGLASDPAMGARFHHAMAMLLSRRSRDQLHTHGLAATALQTETQLTGQSPDPAPAFQDAGWEALFSPESLARGEQRFRWLIRHLRLPQSS